MTDPWEMSLQVVRDLNANPSGDQRAIIARWLRKAKDDEIERLKAGWETAFNIGVSEQEQNKKLRAEIDRLTAALEEIAEFPERAVTIARRALEHKP